MEAIGVNMLVGRAESGGQGDAGILSPKDCMEEKWVMPEVGGARAQWEQTGFHKWEC